MTTRVLSLALVLALASCGGSDENPVSKTTDPLVDFGIEPPDVVTGWPCPPFEGVATTEDKVGDSDGDTLTDCQEDQLGSDSGEQDSDGDGVSDLLEVGGDVLDPLDTDGDLMLDLVDTDDDGDSLLTADEDTNGNGDFRDDDNDGDGKLDYVDADDDNDTVPGAMEDWDGDGDIRNDDTDGDDISDYLDNDDDNDGSLTRYEDTDANRTPTNDDTDFDGVIDMHDTDDDGDGLLTSEEDGNGDGDPANDDLDEDDVRDFADVDEDGDGVPTIALPLDPEYDPERTEDRDGDGDVTNDDIDGDGIPDYRDNDDDNDLVTDEDIDGENGEGDGNALNDDTDGDTIPNVLDRDDDGDGCPTDGEDTDGENGEGDGDPTNDGVDGTDTVPNYLDPTATACNVTVPSTFDLTVTGSALPAPLNGQTVIGALIREGGGGTQVGADVSVTVAKGAFTMAFPPGVLEEGASYHVDLFVDSDASGTCAAPEPSFRVDGIDAVSQDETRALNTVADVNANACATFP